jgi:hypothetical protein
MATVPWIFQRPAQRALRHTSMNSRRWRWWICHVIRVAMKHLAALLKPSFFNVADPQTELTSDLATSSPNRLEAALKIEKDNWTFRTSSRDQYTTVGYPRVRQEKFLTMDKKMVDFPCQPTSWQIWTPSPFPTVHFTFCWSCKKANSCSRIRFVSCQFSLTIIECATW